MFKTDDVESLDDKEIIIKSYESGRIEGFIFGTMTTLMTLVILYIILNIPVRT